MFAWGPFSRFPLSLAFVWLAVAVPILRSQPRTDRSQLIGRIAEADSAVAADLTRILSVGSRGWEPCLSAPMVVEQADVDGRKRAFYFALDAGFLTTTPHLPSSRPEKAFAREVERLLQKDGPAAWPVYVLSGPGAPAAPLDSASVATTMRILVRAGEGPLQAASAIVLNSAYWSADSAIATDDGYLAMIARHELYHARRAWTRASEIAARADAIEASLGAAGAARPDRPSLESLVSRALIAGEEVAAIDGSIAAPGIPQLRRLNALEYRERNVQIERKLSAEILNLFPAFKDSPKRDEAQKRVAGIVHASRGD